MITRFRVGSNRPTELLNLHVSTISPLPTSYTDAWTDSAYLLLYVDDIVLRDVLISSLAGALQYLIFTRPNISYVVQQICLCMHDPREPHFSALKRILRYVRGTLDHGLPLFSSSTTSLIAYSDTDWTCFPTTRRLTSGYYVFFDNNLLFKSFKRQLTLSRSNAQAEYRGVANKCC
ncbi:ribonuclease H-like domain-containing protein [Tanacetum coccineum]